MRRILFFYAVFFLYYNTSTVEYLYPVAQLANGSVCVIYQKNPAHIELWLWNAKTGQAMRGLFTRYTPGGLTVLPNGKDFSFIDHGLIKIKYINNAIPYIVELDKPLTQITVLHWVDNTTCYTHAKQGDHFGIFVISITGKVETILYKADCDFLYPQKIGSDFYYIEKYKNIRCFKSHYRIMKLSEHYDKEMMLDFGKHALVFLSMFSESEGFVVEHPQRIKEKKKSITFSYHHLFKEDGQWQKKELFTFTIPSQLLLGSERLYESLLPLLPCKIGAVVYFVSQVESGSLAVFSYDMCHNSILQVQVTETIENHFFVPKQTLYGIYCGGRLPQVLTGRIVMDYAVEGQCCIQLQEI